MPYTGKIVPTARTWAGMKSRCSNPKTPEFIRYGRRGIRVCHFLKAYPNNLVSIIGYKPTGHSIDRMNNNGHYSCGICNECASNGWPKNIRWATRSQQMRNTSYNRVVVINGKKKCVAELAEESGLKYITISMRVRKGYNAAAIVGPLLATRTYEARGKRMTLPQWSEELGIKYQTLFKRASRGLSGENLVKPVKVHNIKRKWWLHRGRKSNTGLMLQRVR